MAAPRKRDQLQAGPRQQLGFTLTELVVVIIILGVIAAVAVPRFMDMSTSARIASLKTLAATLNSTAINVRVMCKTNPTCDYSLGSQGIVIGGQTARLNYGWLDAGDTLGAGEIDDWIVYDGFAASLPNYYTTRFSLNGSPDPPNCSVSYLEAAGPIGANVTITMATTGC